MPDEYHTKLESHLAESLRRGKQKNMEVPRRRAQIADIKGSLFQVVLLRGVENFEADLDAFQALRDAATASEATIEAMGAYYVALEHVADRIDGYSEFSITWYNSLGYSEAAIQSSSLFFDKCNISYNIGAAYFSRGMAHLKEILTFSERHRRAIARSKETGEAELAFLMAASAFHRLRCVDLPQLPHHPPRELDEDTAEFLEALSMAQAAKAAFEMHPGPQETQVASSMLLRATEAIYRCTAAKTELIDVLEKETRVFATKLPKSPPASTPEPVEPPEMHLSHPNLFTQVVPYRIHKELGEVTEKAHEFFNVQVATPLLEQSARICADLVALNLPTGAEIASFPKRVPSSLKELSKRIQDVYTPHMDSVLDKIGSLVEILRVPSQIEAFLPHMPMKDGLAPSETANLRSHVQTIQEKSTEWINHAKKGISIASYDTTKHGEIPTIEQILAPELDYVAKQRALATSLSEKLHVLYATYVAKAPTHQRMSAGHALLFAGMHYLELKDQFNPKNRTAIRSESVPIDNADTAVKV